MKSAGGWNQQGQLLATDGVTGDLFGASVTISGDIIVVGAPADDGNSGAAYVFVRNGATWSQQAKLTAGNGADRATGDAFGVSVSIDGNTVIVGSPNDDNENGADAGSAYVFVQGGSSWSQQAKLTANDENAVFDSFGSSVAVSSDTVIVGANLDDASSAIMNSGSAYIFTRSGVVWSQQAKLLAGDDAANDQFGFAVAISLNTAVVGAYFDDASSAIFDTGSTYVFTRSGSSWGLPVKLSASDADNSDFFGRSVAISKDIIIVGSHLDDTARGVDSGSAYVFRGTNWVEQTKLTASDGATNDHLGRSVAISGDTVIVGSLFDDTSVVDSGSAYVYDLNQPPTADAGGPYSGDEDTAIGLAATASDPDGDTLTYAWTSDGASCAFADASVLSTTFTCAEPGSYTVTLSVTDLLGESASDTAAVVVNDISEAPIAAGDAYSTDEDTALTVAAPGVLENDSAAGGSLTASLTAVLDTGPTSGSLTFNADGSFSYAPDADFFGSDS